MKAEIISIGDELLIGQVINTNAAWMATKFNLAGITIHQVTTISDDREHLLTALNDATRRVKIILLTGGLGPTKDDITKETLCEYFNTRFVFDPGVYEQIKKLFAIRGMKVSELNRKQAEVPEGCKIIMNQNGTAPGLWFEKEGKIYISLPGVPYEMKPMIKNSVIPDLIRRFSLGAIIHKTIMTQGIPESVLANKIEKWEDALPENIKLAYLPQPGAVRLRLSATGPDKTILENEVEKEITRLHQIIPGDISGYNDEQLNETIGKLLLEKNKTISTAESCTGGYLAHLITLVPGSSDYYKGSVIAYSNEAKVSLLGVKEESLIRYGAVSEQVVKEMAAGAREALNTDYALAASGIAGPGGASKDKPLGTTWIAVASKDKIHAEHFLMGDHRERNIQKSAVAALNMLRKFMAE